MNTTQKQIGVFSLPVIVGALGFFVDVFDLLLLLPDFRLRKSTSK